MTTYTWGTVSGSWNSSNWTPSGYPNASTDQADITSAGTYTVTVATGQTYQLDALVLDDANATLQVDGTLNFTGTDKTFALEAGTLQLNGVIEGATIEASGGVLSLSSGTFQGVTYQGELDIPDSQTLTTLTTLGGLVVEKAGGAAGGTIALGTGANLDVTGGLTVGTVSSIGSI